MRLILALTLTISIDPHIFQHFTAVVVEVQNFHILVNLIRAPMVIWSVNRKSIPHDETPVHEIGI